MAFLFTRIGKNNSTGVYLERRNGIHFVFTGTIKVAPEFGKEFDDTGVGVALDGIVGLYTWKMRFPSRVLLSDTGQIYNVERMFGRTYERAYDCFCTFAIRKVRGVH
jgi:hypothetical protein